MNFEKEHRDWKNKRDYFIAMLAVEAAKNPSINSIDMKYIAEMASYINEIVLPEPVCGELEGYSNL